MSTSIIDSYEGEPAEYVRWRHQADLLANGGKLHEALELCDEVAAWAEAQADARYRDQAYCWRAALLIVLGEGEKVAPRLRRILMGHAHPVPQSMAAHHLSSYHDTLGEEEKSFAYARRALEHARVANARHLLVRCLNRYANALWRRGDYEGAAKYYEEALEKLGNPELNPEELIGGWTRGVLLANLGSSLIFTDQAREGLGNLATAYECLGGQPPLLRSESLLRKVQLGLSFGYLHLERPWLAGRYAREALGDMDEGVPADVRKGGLFLLGEANKFAGIHEMAFHYYSSLQEEFYPDMPDVVDLLLFTDARSLINPWA